MRLVLALVAFSAPLLAQTCDYTVVPSALNLSSSASTGVIQVTANAGCAWTALSSVPWITVVVGTASVSYSADANLTEASRSGTINIGTKQIPVTQAGAQCSYTIDPKSTNVGVSGGTGSFKVTSACVWQPQSTRGDILAVTGSDPNNPWRAGNSTVGYSLTANTCVSARTAAINVVSYSAGTQASYAVTQDGAPGNLTLSPTSISAGPAASDGRIVVTTGAGCGWGAASDVSWIQIINGDGAGNGGITYHLLANTVATRSGNIIVGNMRVPVTQAASGPAAPSLAVVESAANYRSDAVSPGEIVVLFGSNMGPAQLTTLQLTNGAVSSFLAGTQVLFDSTPAPLIYTRADQVSAVAPYGLAGKSATKVQVIYNGIQSATLTMPVQLAHPGIFTQDGTGLGPGAILNQDTSLNSGANPAARGSVISIYLTGGGATDPSLSDGAVTGTDLPLLTQPVTVTIGGVNARVPYAGGVPGAVAGLTQINAEVPASLSPGSSLPVVVIVGGVASSAGVTVAVK